MFEVVILVVILLGLAALGLYLLRTFEGGPTPDERRGEIEAAVRSERAGYDDIAVTVTLGLCVFVRDREGRALETWLDDRPYQTAPEVAARALRQLGRPAVRAPPASARSRAATSWGTSEASGTGDTGAAGEPARGRSR